MPWLSLLLLSFSMTTQQVTVNIFFPSTQGILDASTQTSPRRTRKPNPSASVHTNVQASNDRPVTRSMTRANAQAQAPLLANPEFIVTENIDTDDEDSCTESEDSCTESEDSSSTDDSIQTSPEIQGSDRSCFIIQPCSGKPSVRHMKISIDKPVPFDEIADPTEVCQGLRKKYARKQVYTWGNTDGKGGSNIKVRGVREVKPSDVAVFVHKKIIIRIARVLDVLLNCPQTADNTWHSRGLHNLPFSNVYIVSEPVTTNIPIEELNNYLEKNVPHGGVMRIKSEKIVQEFLDKHGVKI